MTDPSRALPRLRRNPRELVDQLTAVAPRFTSADGAQKRRLLADLAPTPIRDPRTLARLHETLCFLQAYPDDASVLAAVDRALAAIPDRVRRLDAAAARRLHDSGIAETTLDYPFGFPMARWLASRFPGDAEILWREFEESERLQESLMLLVERAEQDGASDEGGLGWRRWLERAKGDGRLTDLQLLLDLFRRAALDETARDWTYETLELPITWRLAGRGASRTFARLPSPRPFFHAGTTFPRPTPDELRREAARPLALRPASRALGRRLIDAARLAMATRLRELFAFSYANPADVLVAEPGRGLAIALIGLVPRARLPYDGYYAYVALKNGVPVGYGAGWQLLDTLELAVNVFESFRRGESAFILSQVLRAYRAAFGMTSVVVDAYQIGRDNAEALRSGAFYFYHRLGFTPRDPAVRRLAAEERAKIARDADYRSSPAILAALARSELFLSLSTAVPPREPRVTASRLATLVTDHVAREFDGDRRAAVRAAVASVAGSLGATDRNRWPREERRAFADLALAVALIPGLARWSSAERRCAVLVLRAKGGPSEARFVRLLARHRGLRQGLAALAARAERRSLRSEGSTEPRRARSPARDLSRAAR